MDKKQQTVKYALETLSKITQIQIGETITCRFEDDVIILKRVE